MTNNLTRLEVQLTVRASLKQLRACGRLRRVQEEALQHTRVLTCVLRRAAQLMESTQSRAAPSKAAPKQQDSRQSSRQGSRRPSFHDDPNASQTLDPSLTTPRKGSAASVRPPSALGQSTALVTAGADFNLTSVEEGEEDDGDVPVKGAPVS